LLIVQLLFLSYSNLGDENSNNSFGKNNSQRYSSDQHYQKIDFQHKDKYENKEHTGKNNWISI